MKTQSILSCAVTLLLAAALSGGAMAQETWDMPMAYAASNYHSEIGAEFAAEVTEKIERKTRCQNAPGRFAVWRGGDLRCCPPRHCAHR